MMFRFELEETFRQCYLRLDYLQDAYSKDKEHSEEIVKEYNQLFSALNECADKIIKIQNEYKK